MKQKRFFFMALVLFMAIPAAGLCFDVTARVDKTQISREDSVFLTVEVNGGKADLDLSGITDFKVVSRGTSTSFNYINGRSETKASYQYVLLPLKQGRLRIPAIKALQDGQTAFTDEIVIQVSHQVVNPEDARELFARSEVVESDLFVGQQTVFSLKFYTSKRLSGLGFETPPQFKGLSAKPFEKEKSYTQTLNGVLYQVTQVNYVIIPAEPGTFTIDPAVLVADVMVKSSRDPRLDSFFNDSFFSSNGYKPVRVVSNPVNISVSPVPAFQGQGKFSGLVGRFAIEGNMDKTQLKAGESATFTLKISGSGNIMDAGLPEIDLGAAFKVYDDTPTETIALTETGYEGFKEFKKAVVPVNPGKYVIEPVLLIYFDVDQNAYQTVSTDKIHLDVLPSEPVRLAAAPSNGGMDGPVKKQEVAVINKDVLEIKEGLTALKDYREIDPMLFIVLLSIPGILFSGIKVFFLVNKKEVPVERQMEEKAKHHLKQAEKAKPGEDKFFGYLYASLTAFVLAKGKKKGETVTINEARTLLTDAQVDSERVDQVTHLLNTLESVRFGGKIMDRDQAAALLSKVRQVVKLVCVTSVFVAVFSLMPYRAMADPAAAFMDGITYYKAGQYQAAAAQFESVAQQKINNPYLFYNIANAYLKANDIGRAVLWYERAKKLLPNDPDLRFNLEYANSLVKDKKETSLDIMDILFFWDTLVPVKTIQVLAIFCSFVFFSWAGIRVVRQKKIFSGTGLLLCSLLILVTFITCASYYRQSVLRTAVIVAEAVAVRSGMTDTATKLFNLHAGTKVTVEEQRDGYLKISFSKDKVGWIKLDQAAMI